MKKPLFLLIIFVSFNSLNAQNITWISSGAGNINKISNGERDIAYSVISDSENIYLTGQITGSQAIIQDSSISKGDFSFLIKYNESGDMSWLRELKGLGRTDAALNSKGEILVVCRDEYYRNFILKYDADGNLLWENQLLKGTTFPMSYAISIDSKDALYICGGFAYSGDLSFEDTLISNMPSGDHGFILKYNDAEEFEWIRTTSGNDYCEFIDVKVDKNDEPVLIGDFLTANYLAHVNDSILIGDTYISSIEDTSYTYFTPSQDVIIAKYSSEGKFRWVNTLGGSKHDWGNKLSINNQNEILIVGTFIDTADINNIGLGSKGSYDIFLCKLSPEGKAVWAKSAGGYNGQNTFGVEAGRSITTDQNGYIYISGTFIGQSFFGEKENEIIISNKNQTGFVAKYSQEGNPVWAKYIEGSNSRIEDLFCAANKLLVSGYFYPEANFEKTPMPFLYPNTSNFFVASINSPISSTEIKDENMINIYPNPTNGIFTIQTPMSKDYSDIYIYNINGSLLSTDKIINQEANLNISNLPKGIYLLRIETNNTYITRKIVKQ